METLLYPKEQKANRDHKCDYCGLVINKKSLYLRSVHVCDGDIYTWKSHKECNKIASKLKMFDDCDEGLTEDDFTGSIEYEYKRIMSNANTGIYERKDFVFPKFADQLEIVLKHHSI